MTARHLYVLVKKSHHINDTPTFQFGCNDGSQIEPDARADVDEISTRSEALTPQDDDDGDRDEPEKRGSVGTHKEIGGGRSTVFKNGRQYAARRHVKFTGPEEYVGAYWPAWLAYTPPQLQLEPPSKFTNETKGFRASAQIARLNAISSRKILLDSGASEMFIAPQDKDMVDWEPGTKPKRSVFQADGTPMETGPEGRFRISGNSHEAIKCVLLEKLSQTVMGVAALMKAIPKCTVTFHCNDHISSTFTSSPGRNAWHSCTVS